MTAIVTGDVGEVQALDICHRRQHLTAWALDESSLFLRELSLPEPLLLSSASCMSLTSA